MTEKERPILPFSQFKGRLVEEWYEPHFGTRIVKFEINGHGGSRLLYKPQTESERRAAHEKLYESYLRQAAWGR